MHNVRALCVRVTDLSRHRFAVLVAMLLGMPGVMRAQDTQPSTDSPDATSISPETWPSDWTTLPDGDTSDVSHPLRPEELEQYEDGATPDGPGEPTGQEHHYWPSPRWLGLRHSSTHGRHVGRGQPLVGTSWRNRPFNFGGELGTLWLTRSIDENVSRDIDTFGGFFAGYDFDHYWGAEWHFDWSTPELKNSEAPDAHRTDSLFSWNNSLLYYPWGDAKWRPYWRGGIGNMRFDYPLDDGSRHDEWMLTFPLGIGVKYPVRRWLAARTELTDHITVNDDYPTQHNVTLTFGLEWRFGAHPRSYWPWNPDRHIW
jgi:hypothetical protein